MNLITFWRIVGGIIIGVGGTNMLWVSQQEYRLYNLFVVAAGALLCIIDEDWLS